MKEKEKAEELVANSMPLAHDWESDNKVVAIKIALLCVKEILKATQKESISRDGLRVDVTFDTYWVKVEDELKQMSEEDTTFGITEDIFLDTCVSTGRCIRMFGNFLFTDEITFQIEDILHRYNDKTARTKIKKLIEKL
jgi:hypothetical protein